MATDTNKTSWVAAYASVIGNGHIQTNTPCQDNCEHIKVNDDWGVAVVCDGAGSAKFSHIGSDFVSSPPSNSTPIAVQADALLPKSSPLL